MEKAIIEEILSPYSYKVRLPRYNGAFTSNQKMDSDALATAYVCALPGCCPSYDVEDIVLVDFESDLTDHPLIIGKYFTEDNINSSLLTLGDNVIISQTTGTDTEARFQIIEQKIDHTAPPESDVKDVWQDGVSVIDVNKIAKIEVAQPIITAISDHNSSNLAHPNINRVSANPVVTSATPALTSLSIGNIDYKIEYDISSKEDKGYITINGVQYVAKSFLRNRNMLDNPWYTINQRQVTTWASGYGVDRWSIENISASVTLAGLTINSEPMNSNGFVEQFLDDTISNNILGEQVTISIMLSDNTIISGSGIVPLNIPIIQTTIISIDTAFGKLQLISNGTRLSFHIIINGGTTTLNIKAAKLELGSISTLANDVAPDYANELIKCQRYCYVINYSNGGLTGYSISNLASTFLLPNINFRTIPAVIKVGDLRVLSFQYTGAVSAVTIEATIHGNYRVYVEHENLGTAGLPCCIAPVDVSSMLIFSADL